MIKNDIVNRVADGIGLPRPQAVEAVETVIDSLRQALVDGNRIELRGFGVFAVKNRKRGIGRNPKKPGQEVEIPPGLTVRFKPGKELRDLATEDAEEAGPGKA